MHVVAVGGSPGDRVGAAVSVGTLAARIPVVRCAPRSIAMSESEGDSPSPLGLAFACGLGITILLNMAFSSFIAVKDKKALGSDAAVQVEGSIMSERVVRGEENESSTYTFFYEFHLPAPRTSSSLQKLSPMGGIGSFGARVTGAKTVTSQCWFAHHENLPKDCTVRYVRANPRVSEIVAIGADTNQFGERWAALIASIVFALLFGGIWVVASVVMAAIEWSGWETSEMDAFFAIVGVIVVLSFGCVVRTLARQPIIPGCTRCDPFKDAKITSLDEPYQKPLAAVPAAPTAPAGPTTTMMVVTCPDGVAPGQTIQIAQSNGVPMQVQVPPGVAPGGVFQVAVPTTLAVAQVVVIAQ